MKPARARKTGPRRRGESTAAAADWAETALQLIAESGLNAVTVEALAARLGVTKGSFYWHFAGRAELLAAALGLWEQKTAAEMAKGLEGQKDARRRLEFLLNTAEPPRTRAFLAALAAGIEDPVVKEVLRRVTAVRIGYLESCYRELGSAPAVAKSQAVLAYAAYRGLMQLAQEAPAAMRWTDWASCPALVRQVLVPRRAGRRR